MGLVEWRRDKREQRAEKREERQATRLIHNELLNVQLELEAAIENMRWWNREGLVCETPEWTRFSHTLAGSDIEENSWAWVAHAYAEINDLNETMLRNIKEHKNLGLLGLKFDATAKASPRRHIRRCSKEWTSWTPTASATHRPLLRGLTDEYRPPRGCEKPRRGGTVVAVEAATVATGSPE